MMTLFELTFSVDNGVRYYKKKAIAYAPQLDIAVEKATEQIRETDGFNCEIELMYHKSHDMNTSKIWVSSAEE